MLPPFTCVYPPRILLPYPSPPKPEPENTRFSIIIGLCVKTQLFADNKSQIMHYWKAPKRLSYNCSWVNIVSPENIASFRSGAPGSPVSCKITIVFSNIPFQFCTRSLERENGNWNLPHDVSVTVKMEFESLDMKKNEIGNEIFGKKLAAKILLDGKLGNRDSAAERARLWPMWPGFDSGGVPYVGGVCQDRGPAWTHMDPREM